MKILIMQQPCSSSPVERWLLEAVPGAHVRIISGTDTVRAADDLLPGTPRTLVEDYDHAPGTEALHHACQQWQPDALLSNAEVDVLRVAQARDRHRIPGISGRLAQSFRDKVLMKELLLAAELPVAPWSLVRSLEQVRAGLEQWGPSVLKPRDGMGARQVSVLSSPADVDGLSPTQRTALEQGHMFLEQYQDGQVLHADATVYGQELITVSVSEYLAPPHLYGDHNVSSVVLEPSAPSTVAVAGMLRSFASALPAGHGVTVLHGELFRTQRGDLVCGEIACRLGGGLVKDAMITAWETNPSREAYLLAVGARGSVDPGPRRQRHAGGFMLFTATGMPKDCEQQPEVVGSWRSAHERESEARFSTDASGGVVIRGNSSEQVRSRLRDLELAGRRADDMQGHRVGA